MKALNRRAVLAGAAALPALTLGVSSLAQDAVSEDDLLVAGPLGDKILGDDNAPVTVVEYASMTCPHCGSTATTRRKHRTALGYCRVLVQVVSSPL